MIQFKQILIKIAANLGLTAFSLFLLSYLLLAIFNREILSHDTNILRSLVEHYAAPGDLYEPLTVHEVKPFTDVTVTAPEFTITYFGNYDIELIIKAEDYFPLKQLNSMAMNAYIRCSDPGKVSGYAGKFDHYMVGYGYEYINANAWVEKIEEIQRPYGIGYKLASFNATRNLPLNEPIRCEIRLTEWLLESGPSFIYVKRQPSQGFWSS